MNIKRQFHAFGRWVRSIRSVPLAAAIALLILVVVGCDTTPGPGLYDDDVSFKPDPVIDAIDPPDSSLAGIGTLTISGENFAEEPSDNLVYFNSVRAEIVSAAPTQLVVRSPNLPVSDINVRVTVVGAENFSNTVTYTLEAAVEEFGAIADFEETFAITTDDESNLYVSLFANNASEGIKRILPDGTREDYVTTTFRWEDIAFGADDRLYGVRNVRAIFRFPEGGGAQEVWAVADETAARFNSIAVDESGMVWVGGVADNIYSVDQSATLTAIPFDGTVQALTTYDGALYVLAETDDVFSVLRFPITNGTLGESETVFNLTDAVGPNVDGLSLAATADGALFVGTNAADPLILVEPDGSHETFYPGILSPPAFSLAWGEGSTLYMSRTDVTGDPSRILTINTQREGSQ